MRQRGDDDFSTYGFNIHTLYSENKNVLQKKKVKENGKYKFPVEKFY